MPQQLSSYLLLYSKHVDIRPSNTITMTKKAHRNNLNFVFLHFLFEYFPSILQMYLSHSVVPGPDSDMQC